MAQSVLKWQQGHTMVSAISALRLSELYCIRLVGGWSGTATNCC